MKYGALRFLHDSVQREVPIDEVSLTIGRAPGVGILIDDPSVSRRHARLTYEGARLWIEDLGSTNGVFVGGVRIAPNSRVVVAPGQHLRIGNIEAEVIPPSSVSPGSGNSQPVTHQPVSAGLRIEVFPPHLSIDPGSTSGLEVRISNRGSVVDEAELAVAGVPPEWLTIAERSVRLLPGEERSTTLQVSPPRSTAAGARDYTLSITANSLSGRSGPQQATAIVEVRPFADARLELRPVRGAGPFSIIATNRGNAPIAYALDGMDDEGVLAFDFSEPELHADADTEGTVRARIKHSSPDRFGKEKLAPFTIIARRIGGEGGEEKLQGQLVVTPPLEKYRKPVIVLLVLAAIALLAFGLWFVSRDWDWGHLPPWAEAASPPPETVTNETPGAGTPNPATETVEAATEQAGGGGGGQTQEPPTDTPTPTDTPEPEISIPTDGLVAEYLFNRNVDDSLSDDSGQPFGTPRLTTDRFGNANNALLLDGVDDQVVFGRDEFTDSNDISVSVWINVDSLDENLEFFLVSSDAALFTRGDRAGIAISVPSTDSASGTIRAGEWTHLLGTYDGNQIKFYVDGQLVQTTDHPGDISDPNRRLTLGTFSGNFWAGAIDDLRIYDRVIEDQDEIDALFGEGGFKKATRQPELPTVPTRVISPIFPGRPTVTIGQIASD